MVLAGVFGIRATIRIRQKMLCLPFAGLFQKYECFTDTKAKYVTADLRYGKEDSVLPRTLSCAAIQG